MALSPPAAPYRRLRSNSRLRSNRSVSWVARSPSAEVPDGIPTLSALSHPHFEGCPSLDLVGGLRMTQEFDHTPVMVSEVLAMLAPVPAGLLVDATVGGGGHAAALLEAMADHELFGIDVDDAARGRVRRERLARFGDRAEVVKARFDALGEVVAKRAPGKPVVGILFDLGVSSPQLDRAERGFSYRFDGPLDMRMDPSHGTTAAELVNSLSPGELTALLAENGERFARRLAEGIVASRPIETTSQLVEVIDQYLPGVARKRAGHPAKRVFQALRIEVNEELEVLSQALERRARSCSSQGGRCVVLSYHSGEDRLVKQSFALAASGGCICPPGLPCVCGAVGTVRVLTRGARLPSAAEAARNPRAASARLRAAERLARAAAS